MPAGLIVAVKHKDGRPWTYGTIVDYGSDDYHGRSYKLRVTKMGHIITKTKRQIKTIPITAEEYLRNVVLEKTALQVEDKFDKLVDYYMKLYKGRKPRKPDTIDDTIVMSIPHTEMSSITFDED